MTWSVVTVTGEDGLHLFNPLTTHQYLKCLNIIFVCSMSSFFSCTLHKDAHNHHSEIIPVPVSISIFVVSVSDLCSEQSSIYFEVRLQRQYSQKLLGPDSFSFMVGNIEQALSAKSMF